MTAVTAEPESDVLLLRRAARIASRVKAELNVVHVIVGDTTLSRDGRSIDGLQQLAADLGAGRFLSFPRGCALRKRGNGRPSAGLPPEGRRLCAPRPAQGTVGTGNSPDVCRAVRKAGLLPKRGRKAPHIGSLRRCLPVIRGRQPA